jgi:hypothetical protein
MPYSSFLSLGRLFNFLILYTGGMGISPSQGLSLHTEHHKQDKRTQTSARPTIPVFERAKTFHALDRAATVIGCATYLLHGNILIFNFLKDMAVWHSERDACLRVCVSIPTPRYALLYCVNRSRGTVCRAPGQFHGKHAMKTYGVWVYSFTITDLYIGCR